ncbi:hypothetical protein M758_10G077900, partial [Ceratodon purpureus]
MINISGHSMALRVLEHMENGNRFEGTLVRISHIRKHMHTMWLVDAPVHRLVLDLPQHRQHHGQIADTACLQCEDQELQVLSRPPFSLLVAGLCPVLGDTF